MYDFSELVEAAPSLLDVATGATWYGTTAPSTRRSSPSVASAVRQPADAGGPEAGDAAVRNALGDASPGAVLWALSRAVSYMDEQGFPEEWEAR